MNQPLTPAPSNAAQPSFRSAAVARMAGMPVATLRIWEQRHRAVQPSTSASGHRQYTQADVARVRLLRALTAQGHAIGMLASMETAQLHELCNDHEARKDRQTPARAHSPKATQGQRPLQMAVVGQALAQRLRQGLFWAQQGVAMQWVGVFDSLADAHAAAVGRAQPAADVLLWQAPSLQPGDAQHLRAVQQAWGGPAVGVVYRYSSAAARSALAAAGHALLSEAADDAALGMWLSANLALPVLAHRAASAAGQADGVACGPARLTVTEPQFSNLSLTQFAALTSAVACECPSHLAQLLLQVGNFEVYSRDCAHQNERDAALHAHLTQVAGQARMLLEDALTRVALAEGLPLPQASNPA